MLSIRSVPTLTQSRSLALLMVAMSLLGLMQARSVLADEAARLSFNKDVRPILSTACFHCHGPDEKQRGADLRLDEEEGIEYAFRDGGLEDSEGWRRILSGDADEVMPPPDSHLELKAGQREILRQWIQQGAEFQGHWSFIPPVKPDVPQVNSEARVRGAIDAFVQQRLEKDGLTLAEEADKERLLRRVTLDLTGLPPTIAEIDDFLGDNSPDAYEKVVDRLLASPRYGERMTVSWMDLARYGDTSVFHADGPRTMWPWRDWVINAYNDNKPFDEFTREQLAGDLIPDATVEQKIATAFLRNNASTDEGGVIAEEARVEYAVDRVRTTAQVWLGLTVECAQCHDHKYDPISQKDYYAFYDFFNQSADPGMQTRNGNQKPVIDVPNYRGLAEAATLKNELAGVTKQLEAHKAASQEAFAKWLTKMESAAKNGETYVIDDALLYCTFEEDDTQQIANSAGDSLAGTSKGSVQRVEGKEGSALQLDGKSFVEFGDLAAFDNTQSFSYGAWIRPGGNMSGAVLARMNDGNAHRGYDLWLQGGHVGMHLIHSWPDNALKVVTKTPLKKDEWQHVFITYDGSQKVGGVKVFVNGELQPVNVEQDSLSATTVAKTSLNIGRRSSSSNFVGQIDDVRMYARQLTEAEVAALAEGKLHLSLIAKPADQRTDDDLAALRNVYFTSYDELAQKIAKEQGRLKRAIAEAENPVGNVMIMENLSKPRQTYLLMRGNYASPDKEKPISADVLSILGDMPEGAPNNRLGLAQWLTQPDHPLTARVAVNRYWYMLFGRGLVKSLEDFGSQGEWPSHPELLDWLAVDFVDSGWDVKRMMKQIVMSQTYRQSTKVTPEVWEVDPENAFLSRGPRFRLAGEFIRDNALAASGLLVDTIGGPGVKPYQPPGLWNEVSLSGNVRFVQDHGEKLYRRSMYIYWKRSAPAPSMIIFDTPSRELCTIRRSRTNTPLQALVTLNDPQFVEAARVLAQRMLLDKDTPELNDRLTKAYRLAAGVRPKPQTLEILAAAYRDELQYFESAPEQATALLKIGESKRDEAIPQAEHAALTIVMSMIFNLDETLTRG
ncbi:DUF1553 domain-containing protein [Bremerella sp. P1]|uniref:DUF1553 domain-containing protein n=1 Tax=Bremerella sp. P1 TaxID=3026424 RepID=UPI00236798BF|nr:DUF1553 domain-containing protein [Bremerella sp. P1]WDI41555.1 DUF1553 domain-containing protein [Bremerella sp. P1]